jgi:2-haloacid dehalogenase
MKYSTILFDLDGTLFDYDAAETQALINIFNDFDLPFFNSNIETYRKLNAILWLQFEQGLITQDVIKVLRFKQLGEALKLDFDAEKFGYRYLEHLSEGTQLIDGAAELIKFLSQRTDLVLITNGLSIVQRPRIKNSGLDKYFEEIIISEEVGSAKPDAKMFDIAFERLDFPDKKKTLIVGDSLTSDIAGGSNYGIDTCWFNPAGTAGDVNIRCTYTIKTLNELRDIILK